MVVFTQKQVFGFKDLSQVVIKQNDSHFWKGLINVKENFLQCVSFNMKDGSQIRFWEDTWYGTSPFSEQYPNLYRVAYNPHDSVANVLANDTCNLSFWRALVGTKLTEFQNLVANMSNVNLSNERDTVSWKLQKSGIFTVHSMYQLLINQDVPLRHDFIWKLKV